MRQRRVTGGRSLKQPGSSNIAGRTLSKNNFSNEKRSFTKKEGESEAGAPYLRGKQYMRSSRSVSEPVAKDIIGRTRKIKKGAKESGKHEMDFK